MNLNEVIFINIVLYNVIFLILFANKKITISENIYWTPIIRIMKIRIIKELLLQLSISGWLNEVGSLKPIDERP